MANNQMPHNLDAEAALLGCILIDGDVQADILEALREDDFYQESHREILRAMKAVFGKRKPIDLVTLTDELDRDGSLSRAGGLQYITDLSQLAPSAANYKQYFDIVRRDSVNRSLIRAARDVIDNSMKSADGEASVAFAEKCIYDISKREESAALTGLSDGTVIQDVLRKFEEIQADPNSLRGVETGFTRLDQVTNGLQKSDLIVLAARPGAGKTSFAMNIVEHACLQKGKTAAVFSLEMPRVQIVQRLLCSYAAVSMEKALAGKLNQKEWKNLMLASDKLQKSKIFIDDSSRITPAQILSKCRRLTATEGRLDLVMIDYIQLMGGEETSRGGELNRTQEIGAITRDLKIMAKELDVPVIALSQLRRIQTKEPQLSDLRESGAIEQDADIVMFINRSDQNVTQEDISKGNVVKGAAELNIAKHRNGAQARIRLRFIGEQTKFVDEEDVGMEPPPQPYEKPQQKNWDNPTAEESFPPQGDTDLPFE